MDCATDITVIREASFQDVIVLVLLRTGIQPNPCGQEISMSQPATPANGEDRKPGDNDG